MAAPITPEDLYRFRWIDHVRLSPDGERVAYQVAWADSNSRQNRSRIVVRRLLDPEPIEPTAGVLRDHSPEWSPDGRKLAFVSKVGAADQLFVIDLAVGGPAQQLTSVPEGVSRPQWSPDGTRLAFVGVVVSDPDAVVDDPRPPEGREQLRRAPVARVVRRLDYKHDGYGYVDGRYHHVFAVSATGGEAKQLTTISTDSATPTVALMQQLTGPASNINRATSRSRLSGLGNPTQRRTSSAAATACRAAPAPMPRGNASETMMPEVLSASNWVATLTKKEPSSTPGQTRLPHRSTPTTAMPAAGQKAVA